MNKKLLITIGLAIAIIFSFSVTLSFATENTMQNAGNDVVNGVRDVVGGARLWIFYLGHLSKWTVVS